MRSNVSKRAQWVCEFGDRKSSYHEADTKVLVAAVSNGGLSMCRV